MSPDLARSVLVRRLCEDAHGGKGHMMMDAKTGMMQLQAKKKKKKKKNPPRIARVTRSLREAKKDSFWESLG